MKRTWTTKLKAATGGFLATGALFVILGTAMTLPSPASAVSMTDYTWMPVFVGQNVPPNILFIVDFSNYTDRKSTRLNSSHSQISYAVFCLKKKKKKKKNKQHERTQINASHNSIDPALKI